jgi:hypothetical protein
VVFFLAEPVTKIVGGDLPEPVLVEFGMVVIRINNFGTEDTIVFGASILTLFEVKGLSFADERVNGDRSAD